MILFLCVIVLVAGILIGFGVAAWYLDSRSVVSEALEEKDREIQQLESGLIRTERDLDFYKSLYPKETVEHE